MNVSKKLFRSITCSNSHTPKPASNNVKDNVHANYVTKGMETDDFFTVDNIFEDEQDIQDRQIESVNLLQNRLANKVINVSNNQNCTVNVTFNF